MRPNVLLLSLLCLLAGCGTKLEGQEEPQNLLAKAKLRPPTISLVSALALPAHFLGPQAIWVDKSGIIYAVSTEGLIYVVTPSKGQFVISDSLDLGVGLTAVIGNQTQLFVAGNDGQFRIFDRAANGSLTLIQTVAVVNFGLSGLGLVGDRIYVAAGQSSLHVDHQDLFTSILNEGEYVWEFDLAGNFTGLVFGADFELFQTMAYDRLSGERRGTIPNPLNNQVNLFGDARRLYQTVPGCCGAGVGIFRKSNLTSKSFLSKPATNAVASLKHRGRDYLAAANEDGSIALLDPTAAANPTVSSLNTPELTGFTGPEDIELRSVLAHGRWLVCGSSGGNANTPVGVPTLFVFAVSK